MNTAFCLVVVMLMILVRSADPRKYQDRITYNAKTIKSFFCFIQKIDELNKLSLND